MSFFTVQKTYSGHVSPKNKKSPGLRGGMSWSFIYLVLILALFLIGGVSAADESAINASGKITVIDALVDPGILIQGDVGLVTVTIKNTGTTNVVISKAELITKDLTVLNSDIYNSQRTIGGGNSMDFTFTILANQPDGIYYPAFYLNFRDAGSLRYNIPIQVESPDISISSIQIPDTYLSDVKNKVTLLIGNPKSVEMTGITIAPRGDGIKFNQSSFFIGRLGPHNSTVTSFEIIPSVPTNLIFDVNYTCGMNIHRTSFTLPIRFGINKLAADPILNNLEVTSDSSGKKLTGDVSNSGLRDAYGVMVSIQNATEQDNPNLNYVIGSIQADDFSSFELYLPQSVRSELTLMIQYKDDSGNPFSKIIPVDLNKISPTSNQQSSGNGGSSGGAAGSSGSGSTGNSGFRGGGNPINRLGSGMDSIPVTEIAVGVIVIIGLFIGWRIWRKKMKGKKIRIKMK